MRNLVFILIIAFTFSSCNRFNTKKFKFTNKSSFNVEVSITFGLTNTYKIKKNETIIYFQYSDSEHDLNLDMYPLAAQKIVIKLDDGRKIEESYCDTLKNLPFDCKIVTNGFFSGKNFESIVARKNIIMGANYNFTDEYAKTAR